MDSTACGSYNASIGTLNLLGIPAYDLYITELVKGCVLTKSSAVYGDTAWKLTDRLNLDAGVRWNEDQKTASVYQADYASFAPTQLLPNQQFFNPAAVPAGYFPDPGVVTNYTNTRAFVNITPRLGLDYHWTDHVMTYVSYSRGFKSGGFDMRGNAAVYPQTQNGYNSETADNYEVGIKSTLFDDTLLLNLTAFYDPYKNAQIGVQQFVDYLGAPTNLTAVLNAGKQINEGLEIESVWRPIKPLTFGRARLRTQRGDSKRRRRESPTQCAGLDRIRQRDLHMGSVLGLLARARRLRLAQLHQGREHDPERDRSASLWAAQRRLCVHHHEQGLALLD